jgi:hypothetical protein
MELSRKNWFSRYWKMIRRMERAGNNEDCGMKDEIWEVMSTSLYENGG